MDLKTLSPGSVIDRTLDNLAWGWRRISAKGDAGDLNLRPDLPDADRRRLKSQMLDCLESRGGEVSARARAAGLGHAYLDLNSDGRYRFLKLMVEEFGIDRDQLAESITDYIDSDDPAYEEKLDALRKQLTPPWLKLLTQFNALPSGVKFLVDMRADLVRLSREHPELAPLNRDLQRLLISWFDIGFLDLKRITWNEPASLLEKIIAYEAVHEIQSWDDLKNRLDIDRCCYAFFHPRMPDEPLIFVQVALVNGISENIEELLDKSAPVVEPESADTAVFYSISNTQLGLRGVSLGDFLIKRVVDDLARNFPNLKTFATLSPIPGFRQFVKSCIDQEEVPSTTPQELAILAKLDTEPATSWIEDNEFQDNVKPVLLRLCAHYLINEKRGKGAKDSVANFHLTNGARIERLNWLGDRSEQGMERSFGLMVNYFYKLSSIEKNHEAYAGQGDIKYSGTLKTLLKKH